MFSALLIRAGCIIKKKKRQSLEIRYIAGLRQI